MTAVHSLAIPPDDLNLIQRIGQQDERALLELYQGYGSLVYSLALRVLQNSGLAEEVTQDVFLKIWQQPQRWDPSLGYFSSWLLAITRNAAIDRLRKEQRHSRPSFDLFEEALATGGQMADDPRWYDGQVLARLLAQLPGEQRQLIELAFYQGYTHSELAHNLKLPLGTVKTRLRTALQKLRLLWEADHPLQ
ncbi:MAG: sigma-70 family RNA polymerase sigma factor [Chloroflexota bacterium]|nr:sigma-70 family RNA polymerase sigma factor [Chloroflexota bacterium]